MQIFGMHTKSSRQHYFNESLPELTFCGLRRLGKMRVITEWRGVDCGNCIATHATGGVDTSFIPDEERGEICADSGEGGTVTYWEMVELADGSFYAYALDRQGQRLIGAPTVEWEKLLDSLSAPLRKADLAEIRIKWLDARLAEGDL